MRATKEHVGQTVYSTEGDAARLDEILPISNKYLVSPIFVDGGEPFYEEPVVWARAFTTAPTQERDLLIRKLEDRERALREQIAELVSKANELVASRELEKARLLRLKRHAALELLEDFIDGKITHYAIIEYGNFTIEPAIQPSGNRRDEDVKLLSLFGRTNGDLTWQLHRYFDGSGHRKVVIPARSEEEAKGHLREKMREFVDRAAAGNRKSDDGTWFSTKHLEIAEELGVHVPEDLRNLLLNERLVALQRNIDERAGQLKKAQDEFLAAGGSL